MSMIDMNRANRIEAIRIIYFFSQKTYFMEEGTRDLNLSYYYIYHDNNIISVINLTRDYFLGLYLYGYRCIHQ